MSVQMLERSHAPSNLDGCLSVATYAKHEDAEAGVKALQKSGFDMRKLSIVGKDYHTEEQVVGYYNTGDRMMAWGKFGAFWGGIWGLLFGSAFFVIPGVGPVILAGWLVTTVVGALEGAVVVGGLSVLGAAFVSAGVPENSVLKYESEIGAGKFLLLVHAPREQVVDAKAILEVTDHQGLEEYSG